MNDNEDYISIVLGETGVGKSTFINSITKSKNCKTSYDVTRCTNKYNVTRTIHNEKEYYFIDTPGFLEARGDEVYLNELKKAIIEYPKIRCLIILIHFEDRRINQILLENIKLLMEYFPTKKFFEHVIIVRTKAYDKYLKFSKEKMKNIFINSEVIKDLAKSKNLEIPKEFSEYYVNCEEDNYDEYVLAEFEKIFYRISKTPPID